MLAAMAGLHAAAVGSQSAFPSKTIRVIVPFPPGGATDNSARVICKSMSSILGQSMVIDNRVGANGRIGTEAVAKSEPDGYSLLIGGIGALTVAPHLEKVPYDPVRDFTPIGGLVTYDTVLIVNPSLPVKSVGELITYLKRNGSKVNYGSSGAGGPFHMAGEYFKSLAKVDMTHVPYKGDGAAIVDLVGGNVQLMFTSTSAAAPHVRSGKVRLIACGSSHRTSVFPDVPTIEEQGLKGYALDAWAGLFGPAGLTEPVIKTLSSAVAKAGEDTELRAAVSAQGSTWLGTGPSEFGRFVRQQNAQWGQLIRERKLTI